tara:strand:- start:48466 stop:49038 length:573 start_codon:yes stop_codon:yes gene_type:complete
VANQKICVFCASKEGNDESFLNVANELGAKIAQKGFGLIYGGAQVGLMGQVADAALENHGEVIGVIPESLADREIAHPGVSSLIVTTDMHERKRQMYDLADAFIALPGGMGTLEEVFEAATWTKLGMHRNGAYKPVVLLDYGEFWQDMIRFLDSQVSAGFVSKESREIVRNADTVDQAIELAVKFPQSNE